ncbi:hypothetical protein CPB84DRAFT_961439 [Gymnopilus junonius]|uniref:HMG box domain-containing protein n=1 Tax=Gymnopilus junonius TaxID=109634 RepID=A0A9P5NPV7_GYMJU|nr:hypothetical protein CPB84DRAFT_961439 [Gymnopilus junonius]
MPFRENIPEKKKVKRPANNWMLFRKAFISHFRAQIKGTPEERKHPGTKLSRFASNAWDKGGEELKSFWAQKAEEEKRAHEKANPGYKYQPMKKADKERAKLEEQLLKNKLKEEQKRATNGKRGKGKSPLSLRGAEGYQRCSSDEVIDNFGAVEHPGPVRHNARTSPYPYYRSPTKYGDTSPPLPPPLLFPRLPAPAAFLHFRVISYSGIAVMSTGTRTRLAVQLRVRLLHILHLIAPLPQVHGPPLHSQAHPQAPCRKSSSS